MSKQSDTAREDTMVGLWFHSVTDSGDLHWQGTILDSPQPGWYRVQLFEWLMGYPSEQRLVCFEDMTSWIFYPSNDEMNEAYERRAQAKKQRDRR